MSPETGDDQVAFLSLASDVGAVPAARRFVVEHLAGREVDAGVSADAALVATELVTNAIRHGPPPVALLLAVLPDRVRIAVADSSQASPHLLGAGLEDENGRGLALLEALTTDWGSEPVGAGKRVWCELPLRS